LLLIHPEIGRHLKKPFVLSYIKFFPLYFRIIKKEENWSSLLRQCVCSKNNFLRRDGSGYHLRPSLPIQTFSHILSPSSVYYKIFSAIIMIQKFDYTILKNRKLNYIYVYRFPSLFSRVTILINLKLRLPKPVF
jgi:hypothetical protein